MYGKLENLPQEVCAVVLTVRTGGSVSDHIAAQKSAEGIVGQVIGQRPEQLGRQSRSYFGMNDMIERQSNRKRNSTHPSEVKPQDDRLRADSLIQKQNTEKPMFTHQLMEKICERSNLQQALNKVCRNKGAPGIDGMTVEALKEHLKLNWPTLKADLLRGKYQPQPLRRVEIPKPSGKGMRKLSIPNCLDRFIQQAILQVLQRRWDPSFSSKSYGFRPGRSAHMAIAQTQHYVQKGYTYVVDLDLEKFFDQVNQDRLMSRLAREIPDQRVLKLIRAYLRIGIMEEGLVKPMRKGVAQGGPISPFLSNVVLDELDKELEKRGHKYARYADDCNIYVKSKRAGERVMASVTQFITQRLKLKVNQEKSAVDLPHNRHFLGFTVTRGKYAGRRKIAPKALKRFKTRVRQITGRSRGISMEKRMEELARYLRGWRGYFGFCETNSVLQELDGWVRRRLRSCYWKQWKTFKNRRDKLRNQGANTILACQTAASSKGPWRTSQISGMRIILNKKYFDKLGVPRLAREVNIQPS